MYEATFSNKTGLLVDLAKVPNLDAYAARGHQSGDTRRSGNGVARSCKLAILESESGPPDVTYGAFGRVWTTSVQARVTDFGPSPIPSAQALRRRVWQGSYLGFLAAEVGSKPWARQCHCNGRVSMEKSVF